MPAVPAFPQAMRNAGTYSAEFVAPAGDWRQITITGDIRESDIDDARNSFDVMVAVEVDGESRQPSATLNQSAFIEQLGGLGGRTIQATLNVGRRMRLGFDVEAF